MFQQRTMNHTVRFAERYPGYQRFFLACDEKLGRPEADTSSGEGRRHERRSNEKKPGSLFKT